jgi:hypothetical protein
MSHWILGIMSGLFALIGLFLASGARDAGITIFGLGLFVSGILFAWWMIKTAYDEAESDVSAA